MSVSPPHWTLQTIISRTGEVLRHEGVKALLFRALGELGYRRTLLFELEVARYRHLDVDLPANIRFGVLTEDRIGDLVRLSPHCDEREARRRIAEGHLCVLGYVDDRPAYSGWLALGPVRINYLDMKVVPGPATAYSYEVYVDPSARGLRLAKLAMAFRVRLLLERGFQKCTSAVVPENRAGVGHTFSLGFQPFGWAYSLRLGPLQRSWIRTSREPPPLRLVE